MPTKQLEDQEKAKKAKYITHELFEKEKNWSSQIKLLCDALKEFMVYLPDDIQQKMKAYLKPYEQLTDNVLGEESTSTSKNLKKIGEALKEGGPISKQLDNIAKATSEVSEFNEFLGE
jgi:hypothetical protein